MLSLSEEFKSFALSRLHCYFGVFLSLAFFRASTAPAPWSFLPFLSWDSPTLFLGPGSMLSAVFLPGSSGRAGTQKLKNFSWSWVWQVCCLYSDHLCLFEVVLVKADGNCGAAWAPPHPQNPHYNWRCHSPSALFLCIYEDEFERNDEGLRGDGQETGSIQRKSARWAKNRTQISQSLLSSSLNSSHGWVLSPDGGGLVAKSCPTIATPWIVARQAPLSMGFLCQEYWSGLPFPSLGDLSDPKIEPRSPALQADTLLTEPAGKPPTLDKSPSLSGPWFLICKVRWFHRSSASWSMTFSPLVVC